MLGVQAIAAVVIPTESWNADISSSVTVEQRNFLWA
jgi:hypothetical protein